MNRRDLFRLMSGAALVALAPTLARSYSEGTTYTFYAVPTTFAPTLQLDGGPVRPIILAGLAA